MMKFQKDDKVKVTGEWVIDRLYGGLGIVLGYILVDIVAVELHWGYQTEIAFFKEDELEKTDEQIW